MSKLPVVNAPTVNMGMVGDNFEKELKPPISVGIQPLWFATNVT